MNKDDLKYIDNSDDNARETSEFSNKTISKESNTIKEIVLLRFNFKKAKFYILVSPSIFVIKMQNIISNFESLSEEDISRYSGEWIAVIDSKVVFHSSSFKELYTFIKANYPNERPLIGKLPEAIPSVLNIN